MGGVLVEPKWINGSILYKCTHTCLLPLEVKHKTFRIVKPRHANNLIPTIKYFTLLIGNVIASPLEK